MFNIKNIKGFEINYIHKYICIVSDEDGAFPCEMTFYDDKIFEESIKYWESKLPILEIVYPDGSWLSDRNKAS